MTCFVSVLATGCLISLVGTGRPHLTGACPACRSKRTRMKEPGTRSVQALAAMQWCPPCPPCPLCRPLHDLLVLPCPAPWLTIIKCFSRAAVSACTGRPQSFCSRGSGA